MLFLFGETIKKNTNSLGALDCPCCRQAQEFHSVEEKSYFCVFFLPIFSMNVVADYWQCSACKEVFEPDKLTKPSYVQAMEQVLAYLLAGYGIRENLEAAQLIYKKIFDGTIEETDLQRLKAPSQSIEGLTQSLKKLVLHMDFAGGVKVVQAAYLLTYSACQIEFNDRVRINLIGNALNIGIESINAIIANLQQLNNLDIKPGLKLS